MGSSAFKSISAAERQIVALVHRPSAFVIVTKLTNELSTKLTNGGVHDTDQCVSVRNLRMHVFTKLAKRRVHETDEWTRGLIHEADTWTRF